MLNNQRVNHQRNVCFGLLNGFLLMYCYICIIFLRGRNVVVTLESGFPSLKPSVNEPMNFDLRRRLQKKTHRQGPKIGATNNSYAQLCAAHIDMRSGMIGTRLLGLRRMPRATLKAITSSSVLNPWLGSAHSPRSVWYIKHLAFSVIYDIIIRVQCLYIYMFNIV